ncbi:MAG: hypothetical protein AAFY90_15295 [Pseudomonadota bacterium]
MAWTTRTLVRIAALLAAGALSLWAGFAQADVDNALDRPVFAEGRVS